jgi:hypothetical protein
MIEIIMNKKKEFGFGYSWTYPYLKIKSGDHVKWTWSAPFAVNGIKYKIEQVDSPSSENMTVDGFSSGEPSSFGSFSKQFNELGTYYYWSGYVEASQTASFRGVIIVEDPVDKTFEIEVSVGGIKAQKCSFPFNYKSNAYSQCTNVDQSFNWCSPTLEHNGQFLNCDLNSNFFNQKRNPKLHFIILNFYFLKLKMQIQILHAVVRQLILHLAILAIQFQDIQCFSQNVILYQE